MFLLVCFAGISVNSYEKYLTFFAFSLSDEVNFSADKEIMLLICSRRSHLSFEIRDIYVQLIIILLLMFIR